MKIWVCVWFETPKCKRRRRLRMTCQACHHYVCEIGLARRPQVWRPVNISNSEIGVWDGSLLTGYASGIGLDIGFKMEKQIQKSKLAGTNTFSETHRSDEDFFVVGEYFVTAALLWRLHLETSLAVKNDEEGCPSSLNFLMRRSHSRSLDFSFFCFQSGCL